MDRDDISVVLTLDDQEFTVGIKNAGTLLKQFKGQTQKTAQGVESLDTSIEGLMGKTRDLTVILATAHAALQTVYSATLGWQKAIMDAAGEIERLEVMMRGMSTATTQAERDLEAMAASKFITDFAQNAPFRMEALTDTFVKFKTVGIDPTQGSMKALTDAVSAFGGNSEILHRASIAIQQMVGKGVVSMEELRQQLGEAVPSAMQIMARSMRMSVSELVGAIESGTVESTSAINKMLADMAISFDGAGISMMTTWQGILQSLETRWKLFLKEIAGSTEPGENSFFNTAKGMADELSQWLMSSEAKQAARELSEVFYTMAEAIKTTSIALFENREAIMSVLKVFATWYVLSRATRLVVSLTSSLNNMVSTMGGAKQALQSYRDNMDKARQTLMQFEGQVASATSRKQANAMAARTLATSIGRVGMAFAALAGPIGMAVSALLTVGSILSEIRTDTDELTESILRTNGLLATQGDLDTLRERKKALEENIARQNELLEGAQKATTGIFGMSEEDKARDIAEARAGLEAQLAEIEQVNAAIETAVEGLSVQASERAASSIQRVMTEKTRQISSVFRQTQQEIAEDLKNANGDAGKMQEITERALAANEQALQSKLDLFNDMRQKAQQELQSLASAEDELSARRRAELETELSIISDFEINAREAAERYAEAYTSVNEFVEKPSTSAAKVPQVVKDSQRALAQMSRLVDSFSIKLEQAKGKASETNPHLEGLIERIRQLRETIRPEETSAFDQFAQQAIDKAEELYQVEQKTRYEKQGQQALMQVLSRTASSLQDTEEGRLMRMRVQKAELAQQVEQYQELIEKMREFGVEQAEIQRFSDALAQYEAAAMDEIVRENGSAWDQLIADMEDTSQEWVNVWQSGMDQAMDSMVSFVKEGKLNFSDLVDHVLEEILRMQLKQSVTKPLNQLMNTGIQALSAYMGGGSASYDGVFGASLQTTASANGNVMTEFGPAKLNRYANGGIARSPQVSLFGEGSRPEAYVPLPDGRTIPVTMQGGQQAPNIMFNVVNQSGQDVEAQQQGGRFDGETYVLDVVLKAANRPGNFRDGLKGALA